MRKIEYPLDPAKLKVLKDDYLGYFGTAIESYTKSGKLDKRCKESKWIEFKKKYHKVKIFHWSIKELMIADYQTLVGIYELFPTVKLSSAAKNKLCSIFNYDAYQTNIADFFISKSEELRLHSCFYCESSYINAYTVKGKNKKHFDVDHVLPKSKCPLLAFSLFNFVPSCQVCNSRIKGEDTIGTNETERRALSPTDANYDFENNVCFHLRPLVKGVHCFSSNPNLFKVEVKATSPYNQEVDFFHLEERYEYHKAEALRLKDLKQQYPTKNIRRIARLLKKSAKAVEEDIFHKNFLTANDRCFRKFTLDMLK